MSPNEFQLRAALREGEGEGDGVDVDAVLAGAAEIRRRRRRTISSISGGVAVAALIGVGGTLIATNTGGGESGGGGNIAASRNSSAATAPARGGGGSKQVLPANNGGDSRSVGMQANGTGSTGSCPAHPARIILPTSSAPNASSPLFAEPVARLTVCAYRGGALIASNQVAGNVASSLVRTLERSPTTPPTTSCVAPFAMGRLELRAAQADGSELDPVVVTTGCDIEATNGSAVRYRWNPPPWVLRVLDARVGVPPSK